MNHNKLPDASAHTKIAYITSKKGQTQNTAQPLSQTAIGGSVIHKCTSRTIRDSEHKKDVAYHVAGHAAAIYLNNNNENLPPVHFQIKFKDAIDEKARDFINHRVMPDARIPFLEGGMLIQSLPHSIDCLADPIIEAPSQVVQMLPDYKAALEADIVNLLAGPLAEARHVHECDDEPFNRHLVDLDSLNEYYDGEADLALIHEYLQNLFLSRPQHDEKLNDMFTLAFNFVKNAPNWVAITQLAEFIFEHHSNIITYNEIASVLDSKMAIPAKWVI